MEKEFLCNDSNGKPVYSGDKIRGKGFLRCNGGFKVDLSPEVTARKVGDTIYFGALSKQSFRVFYNTQFLLKDNPITF